MSLAPFKLTRVAKSKMLWKKLVPMSSGSSRKWNIKKSRKPAKLETNHIIPSSTSVLSPDSPLMLPLTTPPSSPVRRVAEKSAPGMALRKPAAVDTDQTTPSSPSNLCPDDSPSSASSHTVFDPVSQRMRDTHARYVRYLKEREIDAAMGL